MRPRLTGLLALCCVLPAVLPLQAQQPDSSLTANPITARPDPRSVLEPPVLRLPSSQRFSQRLSTRLSALPLPTLYVEPPARLLTARPFATYVAEWRAARLAVDAPPDRDPAAALEAADNPDNPDRDQDRDRLSDLDRLTDLGVTVTGTGNLGGAWTRFKPCDPSVQFNCDPNLFPQLTPDVQFGVRMGGSVAERIHIDVDYDQTREFDAANNINVYYQGLPQEVLQRVEVGDVSIRLPSSRYLTRGVPAGNFGLMASGQLGGLEFQTVFAQQKGDVTTREFRLGGSGAHAGGGQAGLEQDATLVLDDADYVRGQFFFLLPPAEIAGYPHIDVLSLRGTDAPAALRPGIGGTVLLYRDERLASHAAGGHGAHGVQGAQLGYFLAEALPPGGGPRHVGSFRRLVPDQDYTVHASGLWIMLRSPLRTDEALATAFVTETGDTVGVINAESSPAGVTPQLRLLRGPASTHQPTAATWPLEMHQVYRLDSSTDVDLASIDLRISLGHAAGGRTFRQVAGMQLSLLRFFGLDEDAPADRLDAAQVFQPARDAFEGAGTPIGGTYIVFPTLSPFAAPGPLASLRLSADELSAALGSDANDVIYNDPDPVTRAAAARFQLNFNYRVRVDGAVTSFSLGAFGIREGSENLYFAGRTLLRDIDYTIDYEIGTVMLLNAQTLFATAPDAEIRATWEQKPLFSIAPTTVFGASARYALGTRGELNFVGLHQAEKSIMTRPQLGVEPGSAFLGGVGGRFDLGGAALDRLLERVPGLRNTGASAIALTGEMAFSLPNPNREGTAYLDDFEASDEVPLSIRRQDWKLGSAPQSNEGDRGRLPFTLDATTAAQIVWQHDFLQDGTIRGALLPSTQIDRQLNVVGSELPEPVMYLTFGAPAAPALAPAPGETRRWRSITTVLSTTGRDMTRSEYLEFYVSAGSGGPAALVFDVGTVSEDAFFVDSLGRTTGTYDDGRAWGLGVLDEEARLIDREVWGAERDRRGLWDQNCQAEPLATYALGDARANCTRGNGIPDSEDLNGNGILDPDDGQYFRYVVELDMLSEYLVRDTSATGTPFRLYRIPLRGGLPVNGANDGTWRFIRHMRVTFAAGTAGSSAPVTARTMTVARMRIVGSRWTKRDIHGVQRGLLDAEPGLGGTSTVRVGPVSRLTDGRQYIEPPGVLERAQDPSAGFSIGASEINEKSLRLGYTDLQPDERAEVYYRYPQQPRNMLMYREVRLWVMPRAGDWGTGTGERFTVRVGTDPRNYYLYQSPLRSATGPRQAVPDDWRPELVIDVERWLALKTEAEHRLIERGGAAGIDTLWSADSTYALVLEDRARAPNLAAVRELVFAVYNAGSVPATGEVWINEMRVGQPDRRTGGAGNIGIDIIAGDVGSATIGFARHGSLFRQLNETPHYLGGSELTVAADARLDRMLPEAWALDLPVTVTHARSTQAPTFLQQTDVLASGLDGLRAAGTDATRVGLRISRREPMANPLLGLLIDGSALRLSYNTGTNRAVTSRAQSSGFVGDFSHRRELVRYDVGTVPSFVANALRNLAPPAVEQSDVFQRLVASRLRWTPVSLAFGSTYGDQMTRSFLYDRILVLPGDTSVAAIESPRRTLRNDVQLGLQPFDRLTASLSAASDRDMLGAERATSLLHEREALRRARSAPGGIDIGWETARVLNSSLNYRPELTPWLSAGYTYSSRYLTDRNASWIELDVTGADTTALLQRRFESTRQVSRTLQLRPGALATSFGADSSSVLSHWQRIDLGWRGTLSSQFERETFTPGVGYQLGLGGFDAFRAMGADTAARAQHRESFSAGTGLTMPGSGTINVNYTVEDIETFDARGGSRTQQRVGWPHITLQWSRLAVPRFMSGVVTSLGASVGVQRNETTTAYGVLSGSAGSGGAAGGTGQTRAVTELRFPVSLNLMLGHAFSITYRGAFTTGENLDPTGNVESGGHQQDIGLTGVFQPRESWRTKLNGPITARLSYNEQQQSQCRYNPTLAELDGCISFLDLGTRNANFTLESMVSDITVGALFSYVARQSHVGTRNGTTQFQFGLYGRFNFTAGVMPDGY